jgi:hypothetical protein
VAPSGDAEADADAEEGAAPAAFDQLLRRAAAARQVQREGDEEAETGSAQGTQDRAD